MRQCLTGIMLFLALGSFSQMDSTIVLTFTDFMTIVKANHPVAKQAELMPLSAKADLLKAKGGFDPKLFTEIDAKEFNEKNYYFLSNSGLKVPTWFGVELKAGYEANRGKYLGNEHSTPASGLWYGGISVPIGKNLFIDERRTTLKQANLMIGNSEVERSLMYNDLILHASAAYWDWFKAEQLLETSVSALQLADERFSAVKIGAELGEYAFIDTVEAKLLRDTRKIELQQASVNAVYYRSVLNTYLWLPDLVPLELEESTKPQQDVSFQISLPEVTVDSTLWIRKYAYKMDYLDLEERLKKEMLKPQVDLRYTPLLQPTSNDLFLPFSANNMKWGVTASFPLFLRKERGDLQSVRLKQQNNQFEMEAKVLELKNKLNATSFLITSLQAQIALQEEMIASYLLMRNAELQKFEIGESSLFLVNSREMKYIESRQKLIELKAKLELAKAEYRWLSAEL